MVALQTPRVKTGWQARDFRLQGTDGKHYSLQDVRGRNGLVVMFICNHCPYVQSIADKIVRDMKELATLGVGSIAIMPNDTTTYPDDSLDNMIAFQARHGFPFPYVIDETQETAQAYDAVCTPDFFGFNDGLTLQYRGRLDNSGRNSSEASQRELFEAMKQVAATGKASAGQNPSIGCSIKWRNS